MENQKYKVSITEAHQNMFEAHKQNYSLVIMFLLFMGVCIFSFNNVKELMENEHFEIGFIVGAFEYVALIIAFHIYSVIIVSILVRHIKNEQQGFTPIIKSLFSLNALWALLIVFAWITVSFILFGVMLFCLAIAALFAKGLSHTNGGGFLAKPMKWLFTVNVFFALLYVTMLPALFYQNTSLKEAYNYSFLCYSGPVRNAMIIPLIIGIIMAWLISYLPIDFVLPSVLVLSHYYINVITFLYVQFINKVQPIKKPSA